jgi:transposase-like protein
MAKYRTFTPEFKAQVVLAVLTGSKSAAEVCREHQLKDSVFYRWKDQFLQNSSKAFRQDDQARQDQERITELENLVGRLTLQLEIAKKASSILKAPSPSNDR